MLFSGVNTIISSRCLDHPPLVRDNRACVNHSRKWLLLGRWHQLPDVGVWPQLSLLACFQRLVELQESTRILMDLGQPQPNHQYSELKARFLVFVSWSQSGRTADLMSLSLRGPCNSIGDLFAPLYYQWDVLGVEFF